jgi:hypothetical protein
MNKVICIDDSAKPNDISNKNWVKKNEKYTVVKMCISKLSNDKYFVLEEVQPESPYGGYNIKRFGIDIDDLEELVKEMIEHWLNILSK